jgi:hypothetical protein
MMAAGARRLRCRTNRSYQVFRCRSYHSGCHGRLLGSLRRCKGENRGR